ncbi:MAG: hypothetical protein ACP5O7_06700 [Phycisphaerae bacterium]
MKLFLGVAIKLLGVSVLAVVALVIVGVMVHGFAAAARQDSKNDAIKVVRMYASPPNNTLVVRLFVVKNETAKTITAIKFRVVVLNKLKEKIDTTTVEFEKPVAPKSTVYCNVYTVFDSDGLVSASGCNVNHTDRRLLALAKQVGCKPEDLLVTNPYKVKVLSVAY